jgi:hypothetical protein
MVMDMALTKVVVIVQRKWMVNILAVKGPGSALARTEISGNSWKDDGIPGKTR